MQDVPKIVKERLRAGTATANHPEADVLAAFSERLLPEVDRAIVLEHLGRCAQCRDVVLLALPAEEQVATVVAASPSRGWLAWPALRWGFVAAGVVIVASLGIVQYRQQARSIVAVKSAPVAPVATEARNEEVPPSAATEPAKKQESSLSAPAAAEANADKAQMPAKVPHRVGGEEGSAARVEPSVGGGRGAGVGMAYGATPHGPRMNMQWPQNGMQANVQNNAAIPAAPAPLSRMRPGGHVAANPQVPAASQTVTVEVAGAAPPVQTETNQVAGADQSAASAPAANGEARVSRGKDAETSEATALHSTVAAPVQAPIVGRNVTQLVNVAPGAEPIWNISAAGGLQCSFDQGRTWRDVDVSGNGASIGANVGGPIPKARVAKAMPAPPVVFRTVAANGLDVWAGGSGGQLYHSSDAGAHWSRIMPSAGDATLTGDVIRLEFPDPAHGAVSTSAGEIWTTANGGQSWQKQ